MKVSVFQIANWVCVKKVFQLTSSSDTGIAEFLTLKCSNISNKMTMIAIISASKFHNKFFLIHKFELFRVSRKSGLLIFVLNNNFNSFLLIKSCKDTQTKITLILFYTHIFKLRFYILTPLQINITPLAVIMNRKIKKSPVKLNFWWSQ